jgi:hypothetical protein
MAALVAWAFYEGFAAAAKAVISIMLADGIRFALS